MGIPGPWVFLVHGLSWSMVYLGPWVFLVHGLSWSMGIPGPWVFLVHDSSSISMIFHEIPWISTNFHEFPWFSTKFPIKSRGAYAVYVPATPVCLWYSPWPGYTPVPATPCLVHRPRAEQRQSRTQTSQEARTWNCRLVGLLPRVQCRYPDLCTFQRNSRFCGNFIDNFWTE